MPCGPEREKRLLATLPTASFATLPLGRPSGSGAAYRERANPARAVCSRAPVVGPHIAACAALGIRRAVIREVAAPGAEPQVAVARRRSNPATAGDNTRRPVDGLDEYPAAVRKVVAVDAYSPERRPGIRQIRGAPRECGCNAERGDDRHNQE